MAVLKSPYDFVGISTRDGHQRLYDLEIVVEDLRNWFATRKGELDWNPEFGSTVPDLLFELKTIKNKEELESEVRRGIDSDPRLTLVSLKIEEQEHGYTAYISANYLKQNPAIQFQVDFDKRNFGEKIT